MLMQCKSIYARPTPRVLQWGHLFFKCRLEKGIWCQLNSDRERVALAVTVLVRDAMGMILKSKEDCNLLMIIATWFIWNECNLIREEGEEGHRRIVDFIARCIKVLCGWKCLGAGRKFKDNQKSL